MKRLRGAHELVVGAALCDAAVLEHDDLVRGLDQAWVVCCDHDRRVVLEQFVAQDADDFCLRRRVDAGGGLVEQQERRLPDQGSGQGDSLALAAREGLSALCEYGVVAVREAHDRVVNASRVGCGFHLVVACVGAAVADVVGDCESEENGLLQDERDL